MTRNYKNFHGGEWQDAASGSIAPNLNPADGDLVGEFASSSVEDVDQAVGSAHDAKHLWAQTPPVERAAIVRRAAALLRERVDAVARDLTREEGKTIGEARAETLNAVGKMEFAAEETSSLSGETLVTSDPGVHLYTLREPLGVVASISPWNFPLSTPAGKVGIALVTGNTVVIKPASLTPLSATHLTQAFADSGIPPGVVNLVTGGGGSVGQALVDDPRVDGVTFTGSTAVGVGVGEVAARHLAKTQLELGGKNPLVVMEDADLDLAARAVVDGAFRSCGQKCTATSRLMVHQAVKEPLLDRIIAATSEITVGDGLNPETYMGPLVDRHQLESVSSYIEVGREEGAKLLIGGDRLTDGPYAKGFFLTPAIFDHVEPSMRIATEEIFGPVLSVLTVSNLDQAIEIANASEYGLSSAIFTRSLGYAHEFARRVQAGVVKINGQTPGNAANAPFGGRKKSGSNISLKPLDFFTELKSVYQRFK